MPAQVMGDASKKCLRREDLCEVWEISGRGKGAGQERKGHMVSISV